VIAGVIREHFLEGGIGTVGVRADVPTGVDGKD